jgi:hypothetical protein
MPIIDSLMIGTGGNINGPCLMRVPDWLPPDERADSSANYYLYFAHHWGKNIKMAWSRIPTGPYQIYEPQDGVFHIDSCAAQVNLSLNNHVASPDVLVDHENQRFIMYFHVGTPVWNNDTLYYQKTVVATSTDGLDFNDGLQNVIICPAYARVFEFNMSLYSITPTGVFKAPNPSIPWEHSETFSDKNPGLWTYVGHPMALISNNIRHMGVLKDLNNLHVVYSRYYTLSEHIEYTRIELNPLERYWRVSKPESVLFPELDWEGVHYPLKESMPGIARKGVRELRDPYLFRDHDGLVYLLYTGAGEKAIGIARVDGLFDSNTVRDSCTSWCLDSVKVFPNPVNEGRLFIHGIESSARMEVISQQGVNLMPPIEVSQGYHAIDLPGIPSGIIFISIIRNDCSCIKKVIIR